VGEEFLVLQVCSSGKNISNSRLEVTTFKQNFSFLSVVVTITTSYKYVYHITY